MNNELKPDVGQQLNFIAAFLPNGALECTIPAVQPNKKLSHTWGFTSQKNPFNLKTVVTWILTPTATGTHLRMEQSGFRPYQPQAYQGAQWGWPRQFTALEQLLARTG